VNCALSAAQFSRRGTEVGTLKALRDRAIVGDMLEHAHTPSYAALKANAEALLGRELTPEEARTLYEQAVVVELPRDLHQADRTYGARNTAEQIALDAADPEGAVARDAEWLVKAAEDLGIDVQDVADAMVQADALNRDKGTY
jgi:filamentous hemagglutinin